MRGLKILVTGAQGFVGRNLVENLKNKKYGKKDSCPKVAEIFPYDKGNTQEQLENYCRECDFVFHLAGVNRPQNREDFYTGNIQFVKRLLDMLKACGNTCPIMYASSLQASLCGRFAGSEYGKSKLAGEQLLFQYAEDTGARVYVYRFPNLFGKWCLPNYNSAVATFCNAVANDLDFKINDPDTKLELLYIDDLIYELFGVLEGREHRCEYPVDGKHSGLEAVPDAKGRYCYVPVTYHVTLGEISSLLHTYNNMIPSLMIPDMPKDSFSKKLCSTYLSYLPVSKMDYPLKMNPDYRGNFTELFRACGCGQISVNVTKPAITRGQHWHNSKWEVFIVVSGHGLIQKRRVGIEPETNKPYPVIEFEVTGDHIKAVQILPGYTHNIINLSQTDNLVTLIWANEPFDEEYPDTFYEPVV